jgi:hypothetical protein
MPIHANTFIWENAPKPGDKPKPAEILDAKPLSDDFEIKTPAEDIMLTEDGTLSVKRSQYTEDLVEKK